MAPGSECLAHHTCRVNSAVWHSLTSFRVDGSTLTDGTPNQMTAYTARTRTD